MAVKFKNVTKHGVENFVPGVALGFEDPDAEPYFIACGWADATNDEPVIVYEAGRVEVDPETRQNGTGILVADLISQLTQE